MKIASFFDFLEAKPLYYDEIDHRRVHHAYALLHAHIKHPRTIHIVGTNGKGSTGRMLAHLAYLSGLSVGHFSSPHILKFNERIWIDGLDSSDEVLELAHQKLYAILGQKMSEALSYFEYTTLLALVAFEQVDFIVLEAGLGGEFDATNVCDKELSIITPIGIDHQAFLGDTIEDIASTKIRSIQKQVLLAPQVYNEVLEVAKKITKEKKAILYHQERIRKLVGWENPTIKAVMDIAKSNSWASYLIENARTALKALDILSISYNITDLKTLKLFGRFYPLMDNIRIDVGHNPLAAQAIVKALNRSIVLIYNSLDDKDYEQVLRILKPKITRVEILPITNQRAVTSQSIKKALEKLEIAYSEFSGSVVDDEEYLVFGSFYVVEEFLKRYTSCT